VSGHAKPSHGNRSTVTSYCAVHLYLLGDSDRTVRLPRNVYDRPIMTAEERHQPFRPYADKARICSVRFRAGSTQQDFNNFWQTELDSKRSDELAIIYCQGHAFSSNS
jgi:hypothetical protein